VFQALAGAALSFVSTILLLLTERDVIIHKNPESRVTSLTNAQNNGKIKTLAAANANKSLQAPFVLCFRI